MVHRIHKPVKALLLAAIGLALIGIICIRYFPVQ